MSALRSIATAKAESRKGTCPLYPQMRTWAVQLGMSALGQKRTFHHSLDQLIGALLETQRHVEAERLGGLKIDRHFVLGWELNG